MYKTIDVEFCEKQIEVTVELFNHDDQATFEIKSTTCGAVDILSIIEALGGLGALCEVVAKKLKEENCDD